ncbi:molybdenum cofactor guanylyltransferase [Endozoicomonas sp. OPT23]|nr:molybdenum cofactor guanylyltransferase [Endozoicomonas sp. OPT23]
MGRDKALLSWQGKPLYRHMADILTNSGVDHVLYSSGERSSSERSSSEKPGREWADEQTISDIISDRGPLGGIHAVIAELPDQVNLVVVPVDMPLLPEACCRLLMNDQKLATEQPVPVCFENYTLPMVFPVNKALREQVSKAINSSSHRDYSLRNLHRALNGEYQALPADYEDFFQNTNTPEDWRSALSRKAHCPESELSRKVHCPDSL